MLSFSHLQGFNFNLISTEYYSVLGTQAIHGMNLDFESTD